MCLGGICCHVVHKFWTYTEEQQTIDVSTNFDDEEDDSGINGMAPKYNAKYDMTTTRFKVGHRRPLLVNENRDAEDSDHLVVNNRNYMSDDSDIGEQESQDVLFDVLKRRER